MNHHLAITIPAALFGLMSLSLVQPATIAAQDATAQSPAPATKPLAAVTFFTPGNEFNSGRDFVAVCRIQNFSGEKMRVAYNNGTMDDSRRQDELPPTFNNKDYWFTRLVFKVTKDLPGAYWRRGGKAESYWVSVEPGGDALFMLDVSLNNVPATSQLMWVELYSPGGEHVYRSNEIEFTHVAK